MLRNLRTAHRSGTTEGTNITKRSVPTQLIEPADGAEIAEIRDELRRIGRLMWEDLDPRQARFWVCRDDGRRIAWVGVELDESAALLRSLYTDPQYRGRGIGRRLVATVEGEVTALGVAAVYLFSTGAGEYFRSLGYVEVPVAQAAAAVRHTPQVTWYLARPDLLSAEVAFFKSLGAGTPVQSA